ncbi:MAG: FKBP-type peptidyl-prolyl cis-trans isomerase [Elusimicrobia bacterium]|nr:FKBP-type peptidyl-prolyl cis-trans isomerase [Elusimicrobiota bacterium]
MKRIILAAAAVVVSINCFAQEAPQTDDQKILYFLGKAVSNNLKQFQFAPEEVRYIIMGFSDSLNNVQAKVDDAYGPKLNEFIAKRQEAGIKKEKENAKAFLEKSAKEKGAKKFPSGLIYTETKKGSGASPKPNNTVKVHYHGTLKDGKVFDSSIDRGIPAEFPLNMVIPCWTEGLGKMKTGGKAKLVCPSDIAYGDAGRPPIIPGGAPLVFEVELLEIAKEQPKDKPAP